MSQSQRPHHTSGLLLGREVEYVVRPERHQGQLKHGRIVQEGAWLLLVEDERGHLQRKAPEEVQLITPAHPAGLRPVAYQWGGRTDEYQQGWLIGVYGHPGGAKEQAALSALIHEQFVKLGQPVVAEPDLFTQ